MTAQAKTRSKKGSGGWLSLLIVGGGLGGLIWWASRQSAGSSAVGSPATLEGTVTEIGTNQGGLSANEVFGPGMPVEGAVVTLGGISSQPTESDGKYSISGLVSGVSYDGQVTALGYQTEPISVTPDPGDNPMDITLTVQYDQANEV